MELTVRSFLTQYGEALKEKVIQRFQPLYNPKVRELELERKLRDLKRALLDGQKPPVFGIVKGFQAGRRGGILVGETGSGKTICSIAVSHLTLESPYRVIVMCPPHLVQKWIREIKETLDGVEVVNLNGSGLKELMELRDASAPKKPTWYVIGSCLLYTSPSPRD